MRTRVSVTSAGLRKPEMLPPEEMRTAAMRLVNVHIGLRLDELAPLIANALGFKAVSGKMKETIDQSIAPLVDSGAIIVRDDKLYVA